MKLTINELRKLVVEELGGIGDAAPDFGVESGMPDVAALGTLQDAIGVLTNKLKTVEADIKLIQQAQRAAKEKKTEEETGAAAEEVTDILSAEKP